MSNRLTKLLRGANVIVHPECTNEVVSVSDYVGSTEYIIDVVNNAESGTKWGVGTEINLVKRLAGQNPDKEIFCLDPIVCPCATMYRIHPAYVLWVLDGIAAGLVINQVEVDFEERLNSKIAFFTFCSISNALESPSRLGAYSELIHLSQQALISSFE